MSLINLKFSFIKNLLAAVIILFFCERINAQTTLPYTELSLNDLTAFKKTAGNWHIAGDVICDRNKHDNMKVITGKGILVNIPSGKAKDNLYTTLEHGDIDLELDFMMAKGSNSGIYFQGLYEVQLYDSWGVKNPTYQDCGGIYKRRDLTDPNNPKLYEGKPPRVNVSKAPGLWQHFKISFKAPRFDQEGKKIANAKFLKIEHNGVIIHSNLELSGPTGGAAFDDERKAGPIMIQGDHGPVAFRNIKYKLYDQNALKFENIQLSYFEGNFQTMEDVEKATAKSIKELSDFVPLPSNADENYGANLTGKVTIRKSGKYLFGSVVGWAVNSECGGMKFTIGENKIFENKGTNNLLTKEIALQAGTYPFSFIFFKYNFPWSNDLTVMAEGPGLPLYSLIPEKYNTNQPLENPIIIEPVNDPIVLRSFIIHGGKKKTLGVSVGNPEQVNYTVDLEQGALIRIWKSEFANLTPMWHGRGEDQLSVPIGSIINFSGTPDLAVLEDESEIWPDSASGNSQVKFTKYHLDESGRPIFYYNLLNKLEVTDLIFPTDKGRSLQREVNINGTSPSTLYFKVAEGKKIERLKDGSFSINDKEYYILMSSGKKNNPVIRNMKDKQQLIIPINKDNNQNRISYSIIW